MRGGREEKGMEYGEERTESDREGQVEMMRLRAMNREETAENKR